MDITGDDAGVWMTYDELASARDIKRDGARRLAQRHRWRRHAGNDGRARVLVPHEWLQDGDKAPSDKPRDTAVPAEPPAPDIAGVVTALQGAIDTLRQQLVRADARSDELQAERDQARAMTREAKDAAEALRQRESAWWGQGRWRRLRSAWRGE